MKKSNPSKKIDWKTIVAIIVVVAILGYQWYQEHRREGNQVARSAPAESIEQQDILDADPDVLFKSAKKESQSQSETETASTGNRAGEIVKKRGGQPGEASVTSSTESKTGHQTESRSTSKSESTSSGRSRSPSPPQTKPQPDPRPRGSFLTPTSGKNFLSPAGLIYGMGPGGEHRVDHVMRHAVDDSRRPSHGVFDGDEGAILKLIDEAYEKVKSKSKGVKVEQSQGNQTYTVPMGRRIGFEGGEKGARSNKRALRSLRLVLNGERVITAYPYR